MLCEMCASKEANVAVELNENKQIKKLYLCHDCADRIGLIPEQDKIRKLILQKIKENNDSDGDFSRLCPVCGTSLKSIKTAFCAGCPECYHVFYSEIKEILNKKGLSLSYSGKMPNHVKGFRSVLTDRILLQSKLEESIEKEDYEKAAVYRDYLKALEKTSVAGSVND